MKELKAKAIVCENEMKTVDRAFYFEQFVLPSKEGR